MGLGAQLSPVYALVTFCLWAQRKGYQVGEMHGFGPVHPVHKPGSWHYDRDGRWGKAADINWPGGGEEERAQLSRATDVAAELGLGHIFARDGVQGPARTHQRHLHADVGAYATFGVGFYVPRGGGDRVAVAVQGAVGASQDGVWGNDTNWRVETVRRAAGGEHPWGIAHTQRVCAVADDGVWGAQSQAGLKSAVRAVQRALSVPDDGVWGEHTDRVYLAAQDIRWRR